MKITEEQLNKLPQLDRIELRQEHNHLNFSRAISSLILLILIISMLFAPIKACFIFLLPSLILIFYLFYLSIDYKNKLIKKYFKIQVKRIERGKK